MLQEHSAILLTFINLPFVIKIFVLSIFEWPLKTGFTVYGNLQVGVLECKLLFRFRKMKTFDESAKSKKTVSSMIENKKTEKKPAKGKENKPVKSKLLRPPDKSE